jgi:hypothetical protein
MTIDIRISDSPEKIICISPVMGDWSWETLVFVVIVMTETGTLNFIILKRRSQLKIEFFTIPSNRLANFGESYRRWI